jgi:flagellar hook assembly protein FlgD
MAKDASGYLIDSLGFEKSFFVKKDAQLLYVYNYPNPFKDNTYFTFKISQIPDELKIKLFTVAGRLIKEINVPSSQLNYDFNRIPWDGRDDDGNLIANGIYFYKIILSKNGKTETTTQKIAIFR